MTTALAQTISPRARQLLGAMRLNLELLVELEKTDPAGVATIVSALVSHLRSWKPLAASSVAPPLDTDPPAPSQPTGVATIEIVRAIEADGKYCLKWDGGHVVLIISDDDDHAVGVMTSGQAAALCDDVERILTAAGVL